jgi:hypothetical protein
MKKDIDGLKTAVEKTDRKRERQIQQMGQPRAAESFRHRP